jgi:hypothetical protein
VISASDRRPTDRADLLGLIQHAGPEDLRLARKALQAVHAAGSERSRDLVAELDEHERIAHLPPDDRLTPRAAPPAPPA